MLKRRGRCEAAAGAKVEPGGGSRLMEMAMGCNDGLAVGVVAGELVPPPPWELLAELDTDVTDAGDK